MKEVKEPGLDGLLESLHQSWNASHLRPIAGSEYQVVHLAYDPVLSDHKARGLVDEYLANNRSLDASVIDLRPSKYRPQPGKPSLKLSTLIWINGDTLPKNNGDGFNLVRESLERLRENIRNTPNSETYPYNGPVYGVISYGPRTVIFPG